MKFTVGLFTKVFGASATFLKAAQCHSHFSSGVTWPYSARCAPLGRLAEILCTNVPNCDFRENRRRVNSAFVTGVGEVNLETKCTSQVKNALINCMCAAVCKVFLCWTWPSGHFTVSRALNTECGAHFGTSAGAQRCSLLTNGLPLNALLSTWLFIYHFVVQYTFLGAFAKLRKATISLVMSVRLSYRPPAWNSLSPTGRIFIFDIWVFH